MTVKRGSAGEKVLKAARLRNIAESEKRTKSVVLDRNRADQEEGFAREPVLDWMAVSGVGGELAPIGTDCELAPYFKNTTEDPDYIAAGASRDRLELAHQANSLEMALDIADTAQATNSIERQLAHQLGAANYGTMKLLAQLNHLADNFDMQRGLNRAEIESKNLQAARLAGAVARMMSASQQGALALQKLKAGGRQIVTVQHVTVESGGQAVVTGQVKAGGRGRKPGGGAKNGA